NEELEIKEDDEDDVGETARELELDEKNEPGSKAVKRSAPALDEEEEQEEGNEDEEVEKMGSIEEMAESEDADTDNDTDIDPDADDDFIGSIDADEMSI
ncbi:MAG TPA: hypothetical protein DDW83_02600, partial [Peptococcaceae bacterium]|nr:hypothetical protein [Peptococcaceae bacterium]